MAVIFRHIGGRVVPIRDDKQSRKQTLTGTAEVAGGAIAGAGAGAGAAKLLNTAQKLAHSAKDDYRIAQSNFRASIGFPVRGVVRHSELPLMSHSNRQVATAIAKRATAKKMFRARNPILAAGASIAALGIGSGTDKIINAGKKKGEEKNHSVGRAVGAAAAFATYGAYEYSRGIKNPLKIAANVYARAKGLARPFKKFGKGGPI